MLFLHSQAKTVFIHLRSGHLHSRGLAGTKSAAEISVGFQCAQTLMTSAIELSVEDSIPLATSLKIRIMSGPKKKIIIIKMDVLYTRQLKRAAAAKRGPTTSPWVTGFSFNQKEYKRKSSWMSIPVG